MTARMRLAVSGLIAAVAFGVGFAIAIAVPAIGSATQQDITDYYNDDTRMNLVIVMFFVMVVGCLAMVWFFSEMNARLDDGVLTRVAHSAAMLGIVASLGGAALMVAPTAALTIGSSDAKFVGADTAWAFGQGGLALMLAGGFSAFVLASLLYTIAAMRQGVIGKPFYITCYVLVVLTLGWFFWAPGYAFMLWVALMGVAVYVGDSPTAATRSGAPTVVVP
jgi:hypothetical protein